LAQEAPTLVAKKIQQDDWRPRKKIRGQHVGVDTQSLLQPRSDTRHPSCRPTLTAAFFVWSATSLSSPSQVIYLVCQLPLISIIGRRLTGTRQRLFAISRLSARVVLARNLNCFSNVLFFVTFGLPAVPMSEALSLSDGWHRQKR
jgi:hypothetical protein